MLSVSNIYSSNLQLNNISKRKNNKTNPAFRAQLTQDTFVNSKSKLVRQHDKSENVAFNGWIKNIKTSVRISRLQKKHPGLKEALDKISKGDLEGVKELKGLKLKDDDYKFLRDKLIPEIKQNKNITHEQTADLLIGLNVVVENFNTIVKSLVSAQTTENEYKHGMPSYVYFDHEIDVAKFKQAQSDIEYLLSKASDSQKVKAIKQLYIKAFNYLSKQKPDQNNEVARKYCLQYYLEPVKIAGKTKLADISDMKLFSELLGNKLESDGLRCDVAKAVPSLIESLKATEDLDKEKYEKALLKLLGALYMTIKTYEEDPSFTDNVELRVKAIKSSPVAIEELLQFDVNKKAIKELFVDTLDNIARNISENTENANSLLLRQTSLHVKDQIAKLLEKPEKVDKK